jgi:hypothetical protein
MIAQFILTSFLLGAIIYAWIGAARAPIVRIMFVILALSGLYFVWFPNQATVIANIIGIGRGADLVVYVWIIFSMLAILNLHLHIKSQIEIITLLSRNIAINEARSFYDTKDKLPDVEKIT